MEVLSAATVLLAVDVATVELAAARLRGLVALLRTAAVAVGHPVAGWAGSGHQAAVATAARARAQLTSLCVGLETTGVALSALAAALREVQGETLAARRVLTSAGSQARDQVARQLAAALQVFDDADRRAAAVIADAMLVRLVGSSSLLVAQPLSRAQGLAVDVAVVPPTPAVPAAVTVWWAGLPAVARTQVTAQWAWFVEPPEGVPASLRDVINRRRLASALSSAQRSFDHARHPDFADKLIAAGSRLLPPPLSWLRDALASAGLQAAAARLSALRALTQTLRAPGSELLDFDAEGDGRAVVTTGDVERSRTVVVLVPGMSTDLDDVPRLADEARRLAGVAGAGTVVVSWLGYDAPGPFQVETDASAKAGAAYLECFTQGLRATGAQRQHLTIIGHSYGTLVAGLAARRGLPADDLVLLASPGVEAARASDLRLPPGHVWAARAPTDPIQVVFWPATLGRLIGLPIPHVLGPDPASAAFGAHHFGVGGAYGHSGYFTPGSQSLANLGRIVSGRSVLP